MQKIEPEPRTCPVCPTVFLVGGTGNGRRSQRFCSWDCRSRAKVNSDAAVAQTLSSLDAAYLAGFIDADGHVAIYRRRAHVSGVNTYRPILEWVREVTGVGSVCVQHPATETRKTSYVWTCTGHPAAGVLRQIQPYMRIKGPRASLAADLQERLLDPVLKADLSWQVEMRATMLAFNRRGPAAV